MVPLAQKELRKGLSTTKIPYVSTPLNVITIKLEGDLIIDM
jgi:hypothetical protein